MGTEIQIAIIAVILVLLSFVATWRYVLSLFILSGFLAIVLPLNYGFKMVTLIIPVILILLSFFLFIMKEKFYPEKLLSFSDLKWWRVIARPLAMLLIVIGELSSEHFVLYLIGIISILFISTDIYRILSQKNITLLFKKSEAKKFSSMTAFLVSVFFVFLLFSKEIAYLCLGFLTFGDLASKLIGIQFGRTILFHNRTLEGSVGYLIGSLFAGFILFSIFDIPFSVLLTGALVATLTELFSFRIDDNFTVGLVTGGFLEAMYFFHVFPLS